MSIMRPILFFSLIIFTQQTLLAQTIIAPDTTFILREAKADSYHAIFIDTSKSSLYYDYITTFQFDEEDSASYQSSLDCLGLLSFIKYNAFNLPRQWNLLYVYKGAYYMYSPSDYINNYRVLISDSTFTDYYGTGPYANTINSIKKINDKTFSFELTACNNHTKSVIIHIIDPQKGIAVFEDPAAAMAERYILMVRSDKAKNFPVIVNFGTKKWDEFKFDEPDYQQLLK